MQDTAGCRSGGRSRAFAMLVTVRAMDPSERRACAAAGSAGTRGADALAGTAVPAGRPLDIVWPGGITHRRRPDTGVITTPRDPAFLDASVSVPIQVGGGAGIGGG